MTASMPPPNASTIKSSPFTIQQISWVADIVRQKSLVPALVQSTLGNPGKGGQNFSGHLYDETRDATRVEIGRR